MLNWLIQYFELSTNIYKNILNASAILKAEKEIFKNLKMSQSVYTSRIKDQRQGSEIVILLEVSIESLTLKTSDGDHSRSAYVETVMKFYEAVKNDRDHVLSDLKKLLIADYDLKALRPISKPGTEGSLILEALLPRARLVSIQCDHSSGRLHKQLQKTLVTEKLLKDLSLSDITLTFEPRSA